MAFRQSQLLTATVMSLIMPHFFYGTQNRFVGVTDSNLISLCDQRTIELGNDTASSVLLYGANKTNECNLQVQAPHGSWIIFNIINANITALDYMYIEDIESSEDDKYLAFSGNINECAIVLETSLIRLKVRTELLIKLQSSEVKNVNSVQTTTMYNHCSGMKRYEKVIECKSTVIPPGMFFYAYQSGVEALLEPSCPSNCSCILYKNEVGHDCPDGYKGSSYIVYPEKNSLRFFKLINSDLVGLDADAFSHFPWEMYVYFLQKNQLTDIFNGTFKGMLNVVALWLQDNNIKMIESRAFEGLSSLQILFLQNNKLTSIHEKTFFGNSWLMMINLDKNRIKVLDRDVFRDQSLLIHLYISRNKITQIHVDVFRNTTRLQTLSLQRNSLTALPGGFFKNWAGNLRELHIYKNSLTSLERGLFDGLTSLLILTIDDNNIRMIDPWIWHDMPKLEVVNISHNQLNDLTKHRFDNLSYLKTLDLQFNRVRKMDNASFKNFDNTTTIYVDDVPGCCFTDNSKCIPRSPRPPFMTCGRLIPYRVLRFFMWIWGFGSIIGNLFVIIWRGQKRKESKIQPVQRAIIMNLALSDLLMGLYLLIIISVDTYYGIYFPLSAEEWRTGDLCKFAGIVAITSSEASVFFVTLISIDRFLGVLFPFKQYRISQRAVAVFITLIWIVAFLLGAIPTLLRNISSKVYTASQICIGFPLVRQTLHKEVNLSYVQDWTLLVHSHKQDGWKYQDKDFFTVSEVDGSASWMYYSVAVFLGLNFICCVIIFLCYMSIFLTVRKTTVCVGRYKQRQSEELNMAIKMAVIVLTDFFCWVPIVVLGILVQFDVITLSPNVYAWISVFVLPINSAVNPFLYTLVTVAVDKLDLKRRRSSGYGSIPYKSSQTRRTTINSASKDVSLKDVSKPSNGLLHGSSSGTGDVSV